MFYRFFSKKVDAVKQTGKPVLLVASTDMTHYESQGQAQSKDRLAIDKVLALDPRGLLEIVRGPIYQCVG